MLFRQAFTVMDAVSAITYSKSFHNNNTLRKGLNIGTGPMFKLHKIRRVPMTEIHNIVTVPIFMMYNIGTVPMFKIHTIV